MSSIWEQVKELEENLKQTEFELTKMENYYHEHIMEIKSLKKQNADITPELRTKLKYHLELYLEDFTKEEVATFFRIAKRVPVGYFKNESINELIEDVETIIKEILDE